MSTLASSVAARAAASSAQRRFAATLADTVANAVRTVADVLRRRRELARTLRDVERLDAATLRDLGLHRSEAGSVAAELHGFAEASRRLSIASRVDARMS